MARNRNALLHMPTQGRILEGQRALVTGASSGISRAIALAMAEAGAAVAVNYPNSKKDAAQAVATIKAAGGEAIAIKAAVSKPSEVRAMFRKMIATFGGIDILVANAGIQQDAAFHEMSLHDWKKVLAVNLTGQFLCAREAVREFLRRGVAPNISRAAGKIICISSVHDVIPWAGHANYAASKGGVAMLIKTMAQELAPHKIRVNSIAPGAIKTAINKDSRSTPKAEAKLLKLIPYGRVGDATDIAHAAVWLASDLADYITGTTLYIDGGMTLYPAFREGG